MVGRLGDLVARVLDGASALLEHGLTGFSSDVIDVSVPRHLRYAKPAGVRITVRDSLVPSARGGVPRTTVETATIRAAQLAATERQAALLICLPIQQRLTSPPRLLAAWEVVRRSPRRVLLDAVIRDACTGAVSLGELDFARLCRQAGLLEPERQEVGQGASGRCYLDVAFANGLVVEVDGSHHGQGLNPVDDALRANTIAVEGRVVLRIPLLGLRLCPEAFMAQVVAAHRRLDRLPTTQ